MVRLILRVDSRRCWEKKCYENKSWEKRKKDRTWPPFHAEAFYAKSAWNPAHSISKTGNRLQAPFQEGGLS